jgi:hypothetical protein
MPESRLKLVLFVRSKESGWSLAKVYKALQYYAYNDYELTIVDVVLDSVAARRNGIIHTPALIREVAGKKTVYSGDFSDVAKMRTALGLKQS